MKSLTLALIVFIAITFSVSGQYSPPSLEWQKCLGGTGHDLATDILPLPDGGYLVVGHSNSNDGDVSGHHGTAATFDGWLVRLSSSGNITWQKSIGGTGNEYLKSVIPTNDGNFVVVGTTTSNDGDVTGNHGLSDAWVVKFSPDGNLIWNKTYGGNWDDSVGNIVQLPGGGFIVVGTYASGDIHQIGSDPRDVWYFGIDAGGNLEWNKTLGHPTWQDFGEDIRMLPDGNIIISVEPYMDYAGDGDFPNIGENAIYPWLLKTDTTGNIIWKKAVKAVSYNYRFGRTIAGLQLTPFGIALLDEGDPIGGHTTYSNRRFAISLTNYDGTVLKFKHANIPNIYPLDDYQQVVPLSQHGMAALPDSMLLIAGQYKYPGIYNVPDSLSRALLLKKTLKGSVTADSIAGYYGGSKSDGFVSIKRLTYNRYIVAGFTQSNDGDVSGNHGGNDMWIVRVIDSQAVQNNIIQGKVFIDNNRNGVFDTGDRLTNDVTVKAVRASDNSSVSTQPNGGNYLNQVDTGTYTVTVTPFKPYYTVSPGAASFTNYNNIDTIDFALTPAPARDYSISLYASDVARPGFPLVYYLRCLNLGTDTIQNLVVEMIIDSQFFEPHDVNDFESISGDTLRWVLNGILPGDTADMEVDLMPDPLYANLGDTLVTTVRIDTTGDLQPADNYTELRQVVKGSWDPNDKQENLGGILRRNTYESGQSLTYRIRFQNTGTDTAFNITITDTLDNRLNWGSLQMVAASHKYHLQIKDGNKVSWTFNNIKLPDSNVNEPASHGYIVYRILPAENLAMGEVIRNTASIYFDFNLPVMTNTQETMLRPILPPLPVVNGLQTTYCGSAGNIVTKIANLPAASDGITASVKVNAASSAIASDSTFSFDITTLGAGAHQVTVSFTNGFETTSKKYDFTVTEAANPVVNVSANITNITSLATNVIVTATNAADGGTAPLYTFARDRNFTNIVQAESAGNTWTFNPSILSIGENKIYVRMKTSATCFVVNTNIDSILLVRSSVTGITDPDMPGQVINIYPNPFKDVITINGLSSSKTYTIRLFNLEGKQLVLKRVSGRTSMTLTRQQHAQGIYWLSIYDDKRKQLLGTVKMMKE